MLSILIAGCAGEGKVPHVAGGPVSDTQRLLAYNIHAGIGMDKVVDIERIAAVIREVDPDLVALQEVDSFCESSVR